MCDVQTGGSGAKVSFVAMTLENRRDSWENKLVWALIRSGTDGVTVLGTESIPRSASEASNIGYCRVDSATPITVLGRNMVLFTYSYSDSISTPRGNHTIVKLIDLREGNPMVDVWSAETRYRFGGTSQPQAWKWMSFEMRDLDRDGIEEIVTETTTIQDEHFYWNGSEFVPANARFSAPSKASAWIRPSTDGSHFVRSDSGERFTAWGFNYDHDRSMRLIEDYWVDEWQTVLEDLLEMKQLGANAVRIHLQVARFMKSPTEANEVSLAQLKRLVEYSQEIGLYLDLTGLGCYLKKEVPLWYEALDEAGRWEVQALFWESVAKVCAESPAVFCYDLMNEPILPGEGEKATEWLAGEFAGMCFVQRLTLDLAGRTREQVAKAWVDKLVTAIRKHDRRHMITVGVIPWNYTFPGAQPLFYSKEVSENLDYVSVHFYPKKGDVENALKALWAYDIGKPLVVEEMFPLECSQEDLAAFIEGSRHRVDGYFGFYWGQTIEEYSRKSDDLSSEITRNWLLYFKNKTPEILGVKPLYSN